jgi:hypothetical protein
MPPRAGYDNGQGQPWPHHENLPGMQRVERQGGFRETAGAEMKKPWFAQQLPHSKKKCTCCREYKFQGAYRPVGVMRQHWWCAECIARHETPTPDQAAREAGL